MGNEVGDPGQTITTLERKFPPEPLPEYSELLAECQRLREENYRRAVALATAAHELRSPLSIMAGYLELLLSQKLGALDPRQQEVLQEIQNSRSRLQAFANQFLTYGALETGKVGMNWEVGEINACLQETYHLWLMRFQEKGVAFYFPANQELPGLRFDYCKLQQIVSNLLDNALKFTPPGGSVWLTAEPHFWERRSRSEQMVSQDRRKPGAPANNAVRVNVSDTGLGVPPEYQQEIFNDFCSLSPKQGEAGGVGLGLAIARRLVQAHDGKIWVDSELNSGSTFSFVLPLNST